MNTVVQVEPSNESAAIARANLERHADYSRGAYATNTERALRADVAAFTHWCAQAKLSSLPASPDTLVRFIDAMADTKAPATVRRYISSIATFHRAAQITSPSEALEVRLALKRLHRAKGGSQAQAAPLNRNLVERMLDAAGTGPRALRNRALLAVAYDTLCRRSELVALERADLEISVDGAGTIGVRRSKMDQEGMGMVRYLAANTMREVHSWLAHVGEGDGPMFRAVSRAGAIGGALDAGDVARIFKEMALAAGIGPPRSGSDQRPQQPRWRRPRHGAARSRVARGHPGWRWKTAEMVGRYTRRLDARRSGAAKLAVLQNRG